MCPGSAVPSVRSIFRRADEAVISGQNEQPWDPRSLPARAPGAGYMEAPRGALGHWIVIDNGKIAGAALLLPPNANR